MQAKAAHLQTRGSQKKRVASLSEHGQEDAATDSQRERLRDTSLNLPENKRSRDFIEDKARKGPTNDLVLSKMSSRRQLQHVEISRTILAELPQYLVSDFSHFGRK